MDRSIRRITPGTHFDRGVDHYDRGLGIDDHDMNTGSAAIKAYQEGWMWAQHEDKRSRISGNQAGQVAKVSPP